MKITYPPNKKIVCITGNVWIGSHTAPRKRLIKAGFIRPSWFTTDRVITDAHYQNISTGRYHMAAAEDDVLVYVKYGGGYVGIMKQEFNRALQESQQGVLVVGPPEIAAQIANLVTKAVIFSLKCAATQISKHLDSANSAHQLHRIDIDSDQIGAWDKAYDEIEEVLGI